jgi:hypothetical protein
MRVRIGLMTLALGCGCAIAPAGVVVVPNANTSANGNVNQAAPFGILSGTFQWELASSQLTALTGDSLTAIGFRLYGGEASIAGPSSIASFSLELSPAVNPIGSLSGTTANNIGAGGVIVYSGALNLGALTGGAGPNPFFLINFTTPYTYSGGNLVMTATVTGGAANVIVDANNYGDGLGDTSEGGKAEFFTYPITEFQGSAVAATPEPASLLMVCGGVAFLALQRSYKQRRS